MKYKDLPYLLAMNQDEVTKACSLLDIEVVFNDLSNGRYDYALRRVVRYKIEKKDSREVLVCDITGFPTLNYEKKK